MLVLRLNRHDVALGDGVHVVGRESSCAVVLADRLASRKHARLTVRPDGSSVEDLGSANGVHVNGVRLQSARSLLPGDVIAIGETELVVLSPAAGQISRHLAPTRNDRPSSRPRPLSDSDEFDAVTEQRPKISRAPG